MLKGFMCRILGNQSIAARDRMLSIHSILSGSIKKAMMLSDGNLLPNNYILNYLINLLYMDSFTYNSSPIVLSSLSRVVQLYVDKF
jgi:hypothetical protein